VSMAHNVSPTTKAVRQDAAAEVAPPSASYQLESYLQDQILSGRWPTGHKLPSEAGLRKQFGASRTVIREAIRRLQGRGLLKTVNGSGSYVSDCQLEHVSQALNAYSTLMSDDKAFGDLLELRMAIEGDAAAKLASNRSTDDWQCLEARLTAMDTARVLEDFAILDIDFHIELLRLSGNSLFASLGNALRGRWVRLAFDAFSKGEGLREATMVEHREIYRAIMSGDPAVAREAARKHIWLARSRWNERHGAHTIKPGALVGNFRQRSEG
jgi:GntR family transcriptional regulator, transcriptional repressor for pyruvate dehydrogenase complex